MYNFVIASSCADWGYRCVYSRASLEGMRRLLPAEFKWFCLSLLSGTGVCCNICHVFAKQYVFSTFIVLHKDQQEQLTKYTPNVKLYSQRDGHDIQCNIQLLTLHTHIHTAQYIYTLFKASSFENNLKLACTNFKYAYIKSVVNGPIERSKWIKLGTVSHDVQPMYIQLYLSMEHI